MWFAVDSWHSQVHQQSIPSHSQGIESMDPFEQRIEELRNKRASLLAECKVLADKDSLTAEESAEYDAK